MTTETKGIPDSAVVTFPEGVPGFEDSKRFVILRPENLAPVLMLQDLDHAEVSLPVIPAEAVDQGYRLELGEDDRRVLALTGEPVPGRNVLCLAVLILAGAKSPPSCNLLAPIVINPASMIGKQVVQVSSSYLPVYPLAGEP